MTLGWSHVAIRDGHFLVEVGFLPLRVSTSLITLWSGRLLRNYSYFEVLLRFSGSKHLLSRRMKLELLLSPSCLRNIWGNPMLLYLEFSWGSNMKISGTDGAFIISWSWLWSLLQLTFISIWPCWQNVRIRICTEYNFLIPLNLSCRHLIPIIGVDKFEPKLLKHINCIGCLLLHLWFS